LTPPQRRSKFGLLGPYSFGNLGNAALQQALVQQIHKRFPGAEIYGCCVDPETNRGDGGVFPFPLTRHVQLSDSTSHNASARTGSLPATSQENWKSAIKRVPLVQPSFQLARGIWSKSRDLADESAFMLRACRLAKDFRMLIVGLGGVIDEAWNGPWGDALTLFEWAVVAKVTRTPFVFLSVGVEKVESPPGRFFAAEALSLARYRSFRDEASRRKVESLGVAGPNLVVPDLAFSLETRFQAESAARASTRFVGVSPMAYCDPRVWPVKDPAAYQQHLRTLSQLVLWLLRENYRVALVTTQIRMDRAPLRELKELVLRDAPVGAAVNLIEPQAQTVDQFLSIVSQMDFFVSARLHGVVLPFLVETPVLALSHSEKIDRLMADMGLSDFCLSIKSEDVNRLCERILAIESNQEKLRTQIRAKVKEYRARLQTQYDHIFGP
jgi:polysaccharide pyruvyl transferase WcaK-like protein